MVPVRPRLAFADPDTESIVGRDVTLACVVVAGNPAPRVTWTRRGEPLAMSSGRVVDDGGGNLHVRNVSVDDAGEYVCTASNVGGTASTSVTLDVLGNHPQTSVQRNLAKGRIASRLPMDSSDVDFISYVVPCTGMSFPLGGYGLHLIHGSFGSPESVHQTAS